MFAALKFACTVQAPELTCAVVALLEALAIVQLPLTTPHVEKE